MLFNKRKKAEENAVVNELLPSLATYDISEWVKSRKKNFQSILNAIKKDFSNISISPQPLDVEPMLATLAHKPFNDEEWLFEINRKGQRTVAYLNNGEVRLRSKNDFLCKESCPEIYNALTQWPVNAVIDGEIIVLNEDGNKAFEPKKHPKKEQKGNKVFYVFDILWLDGIDLTKTPLVKRKEILSRIMPETGLICFSESIEQEGIGFYKTASQNEWQGIIGKQKNSLYYPGERVNTWLYLKTNRKPEYVMGGWAESGGGRA